MSKLFMRKGKVSEKYFKNFAKSKVQTQISKNTKTS